IDMIGLEKIKEKVNIAIGPQTNKALKERGIEALVCKKHSEDGFLEEIVDIYNNLEGYYD
ncbi:uroporphyrinogen-III C-methyltransferase, partial [Clostridium saudiense]|nr:uroporphyrinogen-III C-methyltransferase [Clostridium saudiense]